MSRKNTRRRAPADLPPGRTDGETVAPAINEGPPYEFMIWRADGSLKTVPLAAASVPAATTAPGSGWQAHLRLLRPQFENASGQGPNLKLHVAQWSSQDTRAREAAHGAIEDISDLQDRIYRKRRPAWFTDGPLMCWRYPDSPLTSAAYYVGHIGWYHQFQALGGAAAGWLPAELCPEDWAFHGDRPFRPGAVLRGVSGWVATIFDKLRDTSHLHHQALTESSDPLSPRMVGLNVDPFRASVFTIDLLTGFSSEEGAPVGRVRPGATERGEGGKPEPSANRPASDPNRPSKDRQSDILATITAAKTPLMRPELIVAMKLKTEGKLGHQLAWMVANKVLVNIPQRGYWPADRLTPE